MQFHQAAGAKVRPAVTLLDTGDNDFVAAPITSAAQRSEFDVPVEDWRQAGLNVPSTIRVHKLSVLPKPEILRSIGRLTERDGAALLAALRNAFDLE
jgi:mRNA interferase MazF